MGVYMARSLCYLGVGAREGAREGAGAHCWGIDPWDSPGLRHTYAEAKADSRTDVAGMTDPRTREAAQHHVQEMGLGDLVTLVCGFSADVGRSWKGPKVGLAYIDGDHHKHVLLEDFEAWKPHFVCGATVVFDDYAPDFDGVVAAIHELQSAGEIVEIVVRNRVVFAKIP
jgi:hypothetical protein